MGIDKPYYRIIRVTKDTGFCDWVSDERYSDDRYELCHAYKIIEQDLKKLFEYINPSDSNRKTYSHRLFDLFLRSSTEFENNCKKILRANGYTKRRGARWDINDYKRLDSANRISQYKIKLNVWYPKPKIIQPLKSWGSKGKSLKWYQDYNKVKHNRHSMFSLANLDNVLNATASVFCVLFSQFHVCAFNPYRTQESYGGEEGGYISTDYSLFSIKPFENWKKREEYNFDWRNLKSTKKPFNQYPF